MRLQRYMVNELSLPTWITNSFNKVRKEISKMSFSQFKKKCEDSYNEVSKSVSDEEELFRLEQELDIPYNLRYYNRNKKNEDIIDESAKHWWDLIKTEAFPTLAFYPALQVWLELDKMLKGTEYSGTVIAFYAAFWLILVSGKYIKGHFDWRKEKPQEYAKEREIGAGKLI